VGVGYYIPTTYLVVGLDTVHEQTGKDLNMVNIWSGLLLYEIPNSGCHQLTHLAIHILSIVANLAGCKQLFSKMAYIHTKHWNQLGYQKVFNTAVVHMELKCKHVEEGWTQSRLKHQLGSLALNLVTTSTGIKTSDQHDKLAESVADVDSIDDDRLVTPTMHALLTHLHQDVIDDEDASDSKTEERSSHTAAIGQSISSLPKKVHLFFGTQVPIPLSNLFKYSPEIGANACGLNIFESNRFANLEKELELYGLVTQDTRMHLETSDLDK
ncbi:unnamed protein product, partial [Rhizoctonia solani]